MSQSPSGPADADTFPAVCDHTHLFPGARPRVQQMPDPAAFAADPWPIDVDLRLSDGVVIDAQLRTAHPAGAVLVVPAHTTGAGTSIDSRTWTIREMNQGGEEVELTIGSLASG